MQDNINESIYRGSVNGWAHLSAGGVLLRYIQDTFEVFLLKEYAEADGWNLPRGTLTDDGDIIKTVIREAAEETGYSSQVIAYLGSVNSTYQHDGRVIAKTTLYHVLGPIAQISIDLQEHAEGKWFKVEEVAPILRKHTGRELEHGIWRTFMRWLAKHDQASLKRRLALID